MTKIALYRWEARPVTGGFAVFFDDQPWPMQPRESEGECESYRNRLALRYSDHEAQEQIEYAIRRGKSGRSRNR